MDMELFGGCNYKCQMCPQGEPGREREFKKSLTWENFVKIVDDAISHGVESISILVVVNPHYTKGLSTVSSI